jgi:hypothetical protein
MNETIKNFLNRLAQNARTAKTPEQAIEDYRTTILQLCQEIDGNGCYTDEQSKSAGYPNLTLDEAIEKFANLMEDN